jgi:hypothetical protein
VTSGSRSAPQVSVKVKKNMTAVSARFVFQSPSSAQNQCPRQNKAAKASAGFSRLL